MKQKLFLYSTSFTLLVLLFTSCKKDIRQTTENLFYQETIASWIDTNVVHSAKGVAYAAAMKNSLDYAHMLVESSSGNEKILILPIDQTFLRSWNAGENQLGNLIIHINPANQIRAVNIVLFTPDSGQKISSLPPNTFYDLFNTARVQSDGVFDFRDINGHQQYKLIYKNSRLVSAATVQAKTMAEYNKAMANNKIKVNNLTQKNIKVNDVVCTYNFWIINFYNSQGELVGTAWELISSNCEEVPQDFQQDNPGGGGGPTFHGPDGSTWNGAAQYEYAVSREWLWTAYSLPYGGIQSTETVTGKKVNGYQDGGYFTGVTHIESSSSDNTHIWNPTMWNYYISQNLLYLYLNGNITGPSVNTSITESRTFAFSGLFP